MYNFEKVLYGYVKELAATQDVWDYANEIHTIDLHLETRKALRIEDQDGWSDEDFYEEGYYEEGEEDMVYLEQINSSFP